MLCQNDDAEMACIGENTSGYIYWCPICGAIQEEDGAFIVPKTQDIHFKE